MIPLAPVPFATLCYGELYFGLCRALAAPWLDPWWLARARQGGQGPARLRGEPSTPPAQPAPAASAAVDGRASATIIPFERSRAGSRPPGARR